MKGSEIRRIFHWRRSIGLGLAVIVGAIGIGTAAGASAKSFRRTAEKICTEQARAAIAYENENGLPQSIEDDATRVEALLAHSRDAQEQLEGLKPPKSLRTDYEAYLDVRRQRIANGEAFVEAVADDDQAAIEELGISVAEIDTNVAELGQDLGFFACARRLSESEEQKVRDVTTETWLQSDPDFCTEKYTEIFIEAYPGSLEACIESESTANPITSIDIKDDIEGVSKVWATVTIIPHGGPDDGVELEVDLVYQDGVYKRQAVYLAS